MSIVTNASPPVLWLSPFMTIAQLPPMPEWASQVFLLFQGSLQNRFGLSPVHVNDLIHYESEGRCSSGLCCFHVLLVGNLSYGFAGFHFSHTDLKRAIVGIKVFFPPYLTIHASSCTLTSNI